MEEEKKEISTEEKENNSQMNKIAIIFFAVVVLFISLSIMYQSNNASKDNSPLDLGISMSEFERLINGITYRDAVDIIGCEGELLSKTDIAGHSTVVYGWKGQGIKGILGANANVTFQNNKLVSKAQSGLK